MRLASRLLIVAVLLAAGIWIGRRSQPITENSVPSKPTVEALQIEIYELQTAQTKAALRRGNNDNFMARIESERDYRPARTGSIYEKVISSKWERFGIR